MSGVMGYLGKDILERGILPKCHLVDHIGFLLVLQFPHTNDALVPLSESMNEVYISCIN